MQVAEDKTPIEKLAKPKFNNKIAPNSRKNMIWLENEQDNNNNNYPALETSRSLICSEKDNNEKEPIDFLP